MSDALSLSDFEPDFLTAVMINATAEADGVSQLLNLWDIKVQSESGEARPRQFASEFYLALGVGLRFWAWEDSKIYFHLEVGLPSGKEVILNALQLVSGSELKELSERLNITSLRLIHDRFVWLAKNEMTVDLGFQNQLDDEQLDAIADFLWNNRHIQSIHGETN
ncbi:MAG: hypothetical protein JWM11_7368 [Planctomycetaceae bacterium]|nr:hypothetical protein [Planctomycetaceae bacterium]